MTLGTTTSRPPAARCRALDQTTASLLRHYGDTVDARRLRSDVGRLTADLDLLCGAERAAPPAPPPVREVIADTSYAHDFWMDAEDEGLGQRSRRP